MKRLRAGLLDVGYLLVLLCALPWLVYQAVTKQKYRVGWGQKFLGRVQRRSSTRPCIWLHAVSVGEVNLLASLLAEIDRLAPQVECVISTTTATGYQVARQKYADRLVFYCPLDFSWAVRSAMQRVRPDLLVLAELELWPNLIWGARDAGAQVAIVNGRLSDRSFSGYRWLRVLVRRLLGNIDLVGAQSEQYAQRFQALGAVENRVVVTGSMKFDGARFDRQEPKIRALAHAAEFTDEDVVFLAGSTGEPEEAAALQAFRELAGENSHLRLVIVPRHPERFEEVAGLIRQSGLPFVRRSELDRADRLSSERRILLVDTVGELGYWWGTAHVAYVGGSLNRRGGQNMIEPAAFGAAVCFGPNTRNFRDIVAMLLAEQAATVVHDTNELTQFVRRMLADAELRQELGERASRLVRRQQGAARRTAEAILQLLPVEPGASRASRAA